ncbi:unnamed protein product [Camellia sinensis]
MTSDYRLQLIRAILQQLQLELCSSSGSLFSPEENLPTSWLILAAVDVAVEAAIDAVVAEGVADVMDVAVEAAVAGGVAAVAGAAGGD